MQPIVPSLCQMLRFTYFKTFTWINWPITIWNKCKEKEQYSQYSFFVHFLTYFKYFHTFNLIEEFHLKSKKEKSENFKIHVFPKFLDATTPKIFILSHCIGRHCLYIVFVYFLFNILYGGLIIEGCWKYENVYPKPGLIYPFFGLLFSDFVNIKYINA